MLRITRVESPATVIQKLEGKLTVPWVDELRAACDADRARQIKLDLSAVSFVDSAGIALLRELVDRGVQIAATTHFIAELMSQEKRHA